MSLNFPQTLFLSGDQVLGGMLHKTKFDYALTKQVSSKY